MEVVKTSSPVCMEVGIYHVNPRLSVGCSLGLTWVGCSLESPQKIPVPACIVDWPWCCLHVCLAWWCPSDACINQLCVHDHQHILSCHWNKRVIYIVFEQYLTATSWCNLFDDTHDGWEQNPNPQIEYFGITALLLPEFLHVELIYFWCGLQCHHSVVSVKKRIN